MKQVCHRDAGRGHAVVKWAGGLSRQRETGPAADEALARLRAGLGGSQPQLVLAFAAGYESRDLEGLPARLHSWLGDGLLVGCSAGGVVGMGQEFEDGPALSLLAGVMPDVQLSAIHLDQASLPAVTASRDCWWRLTGVRPEDEPSFTILADPYSFDIEHCIRGIDRAYPGSTVIGGLTSAVSQPGQACLIAGGEARRSGALLVAWTGNVQIEGVVAQGCRPVGDPLFVTASDGNRIREIDGKAPRQVLGEVFSSLGTADRELFNARQLFIGLALPGPRQSVGAGDFLVREVAGVDSESGDLVIGGHAAAHTVVQFHLRDADASAADLERELARHRGENPSTPAAALMFSCVGRGAALYGVPGRDSGLFRRAFSDVPLGGMFCAGEIGPVQGATFLHGYTTVFGLVRPRRG
jgi:small ligand-binding sensory domain FIST